jgi:hypothetical protein
MDVAGHSAMVPINTVTLPVREVTSLAKPNLKPAFYVLNDAIWGILSTKYR